MGDYTLEQALAMASESADNASDDAIHVNIETREVTVPESQKLFGVESDDSVEIKHIIIDGRYADGDRDLSKLTWRVIYRNAKKDSSYYLIPSIVVNENSIEMDWLIKRSVVAYKGTIDFIVCGFATDSSGVTTPEWNSTLGQGHALEGLEVSAIDIGKEAVDELAKILNESIAARDTAKAASENASKTAASMKNSLDQISQNTANIAKNTSNIAALKDGKISKFYASSQGNTNLPDSDSGRIMDLKLYGKSEQKQYSGKNLLPRFETTTSASVTFTVDDNGVVTANGTATGYAQTAYALSQATITKLNELAESTFYLSGAENAKHGRIYLNVAYKDDALAPDTIYNYAGSGATSFKLKGTISTAYVQVSGPSGTAFSNDKFYPMLSTSSDTTYEPYVGGIPSPNPEYPQEIKSVVKPVVKVCGKNLLDLRTGRSGTGEGVTYTRNDDGSYTRKGTSTGQSGNVWFLGAYRQETDTATLFVLKPGTYTVKDCVLFSGTDQKNGTFTVTNDLFVTGIRSPYMDVGVALDDTVYPRLMAGSTDTGWHPYTEQTVTLPYTLNAIPVTSGGNVTIDGQQYIADYVDVERGKLVRMTGKLTIATAIAPGDAHWYDAEKSYSYEIQQGRIAPSIKKAAISSDRLTGYDFGDFYAKGIETGILASESYIVVNISKRFNICTTADEFITWFNGSNVIGVLATPTETTLTADEIAAFKALVSHYPVTNVSTTSDQLDGYTVFNYPVSLANGWNYVKQQLGDTRDYLYGIDLMTAEAYVNSEYAAALAEIEV